MMNGMAAESTPIKMIRNNGAAYRTDRFPSPYTAVEHSVAGRFMTTVEKHSVGAYHVFMLHGGGCASEALPRHADIIRAIVSKGFRVTAFAYPLFPEHDLMEIHEAVYEAWRLLCELYPNDRFALFGDSAGGALGLNLEMRLRDEGDPRRPMKTVFASPALDMSFTNPEIDKYKDSDISVNFYFAKTLGERLAGDRDLKGVFVSPIYGDHRDLGEILMFYGGKEFLRPDCELFAAKIAETSGTQIEAYMAPKRYHDHLLWVNYPESIEAFDKIASFLSEP